MQSVKPVNPRLYDGAVLDYDGVGYVLRAHSVRWSDDPDSPYYGQTFVYFDVVRKTDKKTIGRFTQYTTDARIDSFFYRYYNREHMRPFSIIERVYFSGPSDTSEDSGASPTKSPYIPIPPAIVEFCDLRVDDELAIYATNRDGIELGPEYYHLSLMSKKTYVLPLTRFKRMAYVFDEKSDGYKWKHIKKDQYAWAFDHPEGSEDSDPIPLFMRPGDILSVRVERAPQLEGRRCFDFALNTLEHIKAVKVAEAHRRARDQSRGHRLRLHNIVSMTILWFMVWVRPSIFPKNLVGGHIPA